MSYIRLVAEVWWGKYTGDQGLRFGGMESEWPFRVREDLGTPRPVHLEDVIADRWSSLSAVIVVDRKDR